MKETTYGNILEFSFPLPVKKGYILIILLLFSPHFDIHMQKSSTYQTKKFVQPGKKVSISAPLDCDLDKFKEPLKNFSFQKIFKQMNEMGCKSVLVLTLRYDKQVYFDKFCRLKKHQL